MSIIDFNYLSSVPTSDQVRRQYKINLLAKNNLYLGEDGRSVYKYNPETRKYSFITGGYGSNLIKKGTRAYVDGKLVDITAGNYTPHYYTEDAKRTRDIEDFARRNPHLVRKAKILALLKARLKTYESPKLISITSKPIYGFNGDVLTFKNTLNNLGITDRNGVIKMLRLLKKAGYNIDDDGRWGNNTLSAYEDFIMKQAAYKPDDTVEESLPESILTKPTTPNFNWRNVTAPLAEKNISKLLPLTTSQSTDINYAKNGAKLVSKNPILRFKEGGYTVKKGDTLSGIAKSHGMSLNQLLSLNKDIRNPDKINIGLRIRISSSNNTTKQSSKTSTPFPPSRRSFKGLLTGETKASRAAVEWGQHVREQAKEMSKKTQPRVKQLRDEQRKQRDASFPQDLPVVIFNNDLPSRKNGLASMYETTHAAQTGGMNLSNPGSVDAYLMTKAMRPVLGIATGATIGGPFGAVLGGLYGYGLNKRDDMFTKNLYPYGYTLQSSESKYSGKAPKIFSKILNEKYPQFSLLYGQGFIDKIWQGFLGPTETRKAYDEFIDLDLTNSELKQRALELKNKYFTNFKNTPLELILFSARARNDANNLYLGIPQKYNTFTQNTEYSDPEAIRLGVPTYTFSDSKMREAYRRRASKLGHLLGEGSHSGVTGDPGVVLNHYTVRNSGNNEGSWYDKWDFVGPNVGKPIIMGDTIYSLK